MSGFARLACWVVVICLTAFLLYSFATGNVLADQLHVWHVIWGVYVWADAYSGFLLFSLLVYAFERKLGFTLAMLLLTFMTGNMINAAWLLWRGPELFRRIRQSSSGLSS